VSPDPLLSIVFWAALFVATGVLAAMTWSYLRHDPARCRTCLAKRRRAASVDLLDEVGRRRDLRDAG
jgi:hypothetical protein